MNDIISNYTEMLRKIENGYNKDKELSTQIFQRGSNYKGELMVVGRAANGWNDGWKTGDLQGDSLVDYVQKIYQESLADPLQWVHDFWKQKYKENGDRHWCAAKSPFWQLVREVTKRILPSQDWSESAWAHSIVWSNLYKVAPGNGGNPGERLCRLQQSYCKDILIQEIEETKPKRILFVTRNRSLNNADNGCGWFDPFQEMVSKTCDELGIKYVVCQRPEQLKRSPLVDSIVEQFSA